MWYPHMRKEGWKQSPELPWTGGACPTCRTGLGPLSACRVKGDGIIHTAESSQSALGQGEPGWGEGGEGERACEGLWDCKVCLRPGPEPVAQTSGIT